MSKVCKFYKEDGCKKGDACTFLHVSDNEVRDKEVFDNGMAVYNAVYAILKTCCPDEKIQGIQGKITGMLLEMTPEEISDFLKNPSCQQQRLEEAFTAIEEETEEDVGELSQTVKEIKLFKKCLGETVTFFKEKRLDEVNVHLSYTRGAAIKVGLIQMQKPEKKNNYTFVVPGDSKEEREFYMNLAANDRFFQNNVRKGLSQYCPEGYFTMKYIDAIQAVAIQATRRY
jgi:hypothetical protein